MLAQEKLESALKNDILKKKVSPSEKIALAREYNGKGIKRNRVLELLGLSKHHYYYKRKGGRKGRSPSTQTTKVNDDGSNQPVDNETVAEAIVAIKENPETDYGYKATTAALMLLGYVINRKKVYRLMYEWQLLHERAKKPSRPFAKHRRVDPTEPLTVLEMDIKFQWVTEHQRYSYILTIIDCSTRKVLHWRVA